MASAGTTRGNRQLLLLRRSLLYLRAVCLQDTPDLFVIEPTGDDERFGIRSIIDDNKQHLPSLQYPG